MKKTHDAGLADLLKLGEMAVSVLLGAGQELRGKAEQSRDALVRHMDLVTREEFDVAFAMLKKVRMVQENLDARIKRLEKDRKLSSPQKTPAKKQIRRK